MLKILQLSVSVATVLTTSLFSSDSIQDAFKDSEMSGQIRVGHVNDTASNVTNAIGATLGIKTKAVNGFSVGATFYTTHAIAGKNESTAFTFLDSNNNAYSILGEAYLEASRGNTIVKIGRQLVDTPYANSDDIGMVPNTFEGITLVNNTLANTTILLASLDKWAGVDTDTPEQFNQMQVSGDAVKAAGIIYEGIENIALQAWSYDISDSNVKYNYFEAGYEIEQFSVAMQKATQGNGNSATGITTSLALGSLTLNAAYNKTAGTVSNGFGGGPFFTSSEDHTIADIQDQEATLVGVEYSIGEITTSVSHTRFDIGENETDYTVSYNINKSMILDLIICDMNADGKLSRLFVNYNF